jgi:hypothetical protein
MMDYISDYKRNTIECFLRLYNVSNYSYLTTDLGRIWIRSPSHIYLHMRMFFIRVTYCDIMNKVIEEGINV